MKFLVGVDGSPGSLDAVRQSTAVLSPQRDRIVLYYSPPEVRMPSGTQLDPQLLARSKQAMANVVLDAAKAELPPAFQASVDIIIGTQPPREGVLAAAEQCRANAIAVGARGMGPIERLLLGSVSYSVVTGTRLPVLVARPGQQPAADGTYRVLVACDGSEADQDIIAALAGFSWPSQTMGQLITVVESMYAGQVPTWLEHKARSAEAEEIARAFEAEFAADKRAAAEKLRVLCQKLPAAFQSCAPIVAEGNPAEQILKHAEAQKCHLIVVGARGLGAVARFFLGSVSLKVLAEAPCSVLLVRHQRPA
jgi:nucleotide-binding universal stress UspA family protein